MKTLIFLDYFTPAYKAGGPIRIYEALIQEQQKGCELFIVTQNTDWGDPTPFREVANGKWMTKESAQVLYLSDAQRGYREILRVVKEISPEVIHLNSLFSRTWTMKLLFLKRLGRLSSQLVLSPHGELSPQALAIKPHRKQLFLWLARKLGLFRDITWIATSAREVEEIAVQEFNGRVRGNLPIKLVMPAMPKLFPHRPSQKKPGRLRLVFLARISAMKNIGHLKQIFSKIKGNIEFDIFGPIDSAYSIQFGQICTEIKRAAPCVVVTHRGPVGSHLAQQVLSEYDLFVQPSLSENFGYSILEALASGTPVLISDQTPWNEVATEGAGAALPLNRPDLWVATLQRFVDMDETQWNEMSTRAQAWLESLRQSVNSLFNVYLQISSSRSAVGNVTGLQPRSQGDAKIEDADRP